MYAWAYDSCLNLYCLIVMLVRCGYFTSELTEQGKPKSCPFVYPCFSLEYVRIPTLSS